MMRGQCGRRPGMLAALCVMLVITALWAAASGALSIPHGKLVPLLWSPAAEGDDAIWRNVLIEVRLPRIVLAITAGAALALSGAVMQALFRNPLAEPGLIGISLGGAAGAPAHLLAGLSEANAMIRVPEEVTEIRPGDVVDVLFLTQRS